MQDEYMFQDDLEELEAPDQCPECGHIWINDEQQHYHDCRYFVLNEEDEAEDFFEEDVDAGKSISSWEYRPAA